jgi:hypothetical protein
VAELRGADASMAHTITKPVAKSIDYHCGVKHMSPENALAFVERKLDYASELLKEYAPIIRAKRVKEREDYEREVYRLERRRQALLEYEMCRQFLDWLKQRSIALFLTAKNPVEQSLEYRQSKKEMDPQRALRSVNRAMGDVETKVSEYQSLLFELERRWDRVHEEYPWITNSLKGATRHAWKQPFLDNVKRWGYDQIVITIDSVEEQASTPFTSLQSGKSKARRGKTQGQIARAQAEADKRKKLPARSKDNPTSGGRRGDSNK